MYVLKGPNHLDTLLVFLFPYMGYSPSFTEQASTGVRLLLSLLGQVCFEHAVLPVYTTCSKLPFTVEELAFSTVSYYSLSLFEQPASVETTIP